MIQAIKDIVVNIKELNDKAAFEEGFGWAMVQYHLLKLSVVHIRKLLEETEGAFEQGATEALRTILED